MRLFEELKRRSVFRVAAAYLVLSWLLLQIGDTLGDTLGLPDWFGKAIFLVLAMGFVPALIFSWVYELTPEGLKKESEISPSESGTAHAAKKLDLVVIVLLVCVAGLVVIDIFMDQDSARPPSVSADTPAPAAVPLAAAELDRSIAVLPFLNLSSDEEQGYFSDGLADTVLHRLAQLPDLRVAARTSSFQFKGQNRDIREIATQLGVATVLEGSIQRQGDRVRITAQLIRGDDGSHLWSQVFDDTLDDVFGVQDEIARDVADALAATWDDDRAPSAGPGETASVEAYEAYLRGLEAMNKGTTAAVNEAIVQLERAVELDPDYGVAWAALARARVGPANLGAATWESTQEPIMAAARRALEVAPELAEAHLAYAFALRQRGADPAAMAAAVERAMALAPNHPAAIEALADVRSLEGQPREALRLIDQAVAVNPLDTGLQVARIRAQFGLGLLDEGLAASAALINAHPDNIELRIIEGDMFAVAGQHVEAVRRHRAALEAQPNLFAALFGIGWTYALADDREGTERYFRRIEAISPGRVYDDLSYVCLLFGDRECHADYARRMIDSMRQDGAGETADLFEAVLLLEQGDATGAAELIEPLQDQVIPRSNLAFRLSAARFLALAYDQLGREAERDALLEQEEQPIRESLAGGLWPPIASLELIEIEAIRGDGAAAAIHLETTLRAGGPPRIGELRHLAVYDKVRDHPEFAAQMAALETWAAELRAALASEDAQ